MVQYTVTTMFYKDHINRCDLCYDKPLTVIKLGKLLTVLNLDDDMYKDIKSDAEVYAELRNNEEYQDMPELINSAIKTLKRLQK